MEMIMSLCMWGGAFQVFLPEPVMEARRVSWGEVGPSFRETGIPRHCGYLRHRRRVSRKARSSVRCSEP